MLATSRPRLCTLQSAHFSKDLYLLLPKRKTRNMDPSAPLTVGVNTLLTCEFVLPAPHTCTGVANTYVVTALATGTIAGAYGLFKGYNQVGPMITAAGINGGIAGATFFSASSPAPLPSPNSNPHH